VALKDRIVEEKIKRGEIANTKDAIIDCLKNDFEEIRMLGGLIGHAERELGIISRDDIKSIFLQVFKNINNNLSDSDGLALVNKFAHGDVIGIQKFLQEKLEIEKNTSEDIIFKIVTKPGIIDNFLFYSIYEATYEILIKLYT
jgi:hypothetical protein